MKLHMNYRIWIILAALVLAIPACIFGTPTPPVPTQVPHLQPTITQTPGPSKYRSLTRANMIKATVQINGLKSQNGQLTPAYSGSGTIISSTGLILTNAHVVSPASLGNPELEPDALAIGLIDQEDKPPVFLYLAKVVAVDRTMGLAVIQITSTLKGDDVDPNSLDLPFVQLGNSDDLHVGDHINIFGYPGIGTDTITFTDGMIAGFTPEEGLGDRAWIKTDATIAGGMSGGLAADDAGFIIGIPTIVASGSDLDPAECRGFIVDTNGDGVVGGDDTCILIGVYNNAIRPVNLALPLIKAAESGEIYVNPFGEIPPPSLPPSLSGSEFFSAITWYTGTGLSDCKLKDPVTAFPSGTTAMAAAWSFTGMTDGEPWAVEWKLNGEVIYTSQYSWYSLNQGNTSLCFYNTKGMPDGNYHIELYAGQYVKLLAQSDVVVGGESNLGPTPGP